MVPLSPSLPSSPAPPRPLLGHPPRSGIHYVCAVPPGGARRAHDDAATAGAVAGAALQLSRRRERQRQRQRQRQRECMLVDALVGRAGHSRSVFVALRVSVLLAACTRAAWAVWSRTAAVHNSSTCSHTCHRVGVHGGWAFVAM